MTKVDSFVILGLETPHLQKFPFKTKVIYDKSFQNLAPSEKRGCVVVPAKSAPHVILFFTYFQYVSMPYHGPNSWFFLICPLVTVHMHTETWVYNKSKMKFANLTSFSFSYILKMYLCHIMGLTTDVLLSQCTPRHGYITSPKLSLPLFASRESFNSKVQKLKLLQR